MRAVIVTCGLAVGLLVAGCPSDLAAQDKTIRLEGDGRLGAVADEHRGTFAAYGYEGTPPSVIPAMLELAAVNANDVVHEPGCGDARVLIAAMRAGARKGLGVDIDPDLAEVAYAKVREAGLEDKVEIRWGDALSVDMSEATVVFLFMGEPFNLMMRPMLWKELKVGARVVSNDFAMGDWKADKTVRVSTPERTYVLYLWTITEEVKAKVAAAMDTLHRKETMHVRAGDGEGNRRVLRAADAAVGAAVQQLSS